MADLATLLREQAGELRKVENRRDLQNDAKRLDRIAEWLDEHGGAAPLDQIDWPCALCEVEPRDTCFTNAPDRFHYGRGFQIGPTMPGDYLLGTEKLGPRANPAERCLPTVEIGPGHVRRGRCLCCGWRSEPTVGENAGSEAAMDHAWPGWRDKPVIERFPDDISGKDGKRKIEAWVRMAEHLLGVEWVREGGPFRTLRAPMGTRHVPNRGPFGNWDCSAGVDRELVRQRELATARREAARTAAPTRAESTSVDSSPLTLF